jgi:Uma2 family endonuclease
MTTIETAAQFAPEDLLRLEGGDNLYELVDGVLVEKNMSSLAGEATIIISSRLYQFTQAHRLGKLYSESSFQCFPKKTRQVRRPDIAFISTARLGDVPDEGHIPIRPDLAIEVVSAGDDVYDLDEKIADHKSAGIPLTWIFNPAQRLVRIYEAGRLKGELEDHEELHGDPVLPGFVVRVGDLMPQSPTSKN